ncbi:peptide deformylase [Limosilactobacillus fastidiosus]|uniref:Peptide deformylase n=1 Tax=Limosilactobacillus fastidiosus TaxID=2759855 RepID=A0A7W3U0N4_9LACO|nr:peptide deformylase [Limosilactobacillus fastidiosus]MBB1063703.1 peptide deformylase [Limosilactobacillus fastidiosus]MBB1086768.1 peptide deformylase [Limosilactobacillus fastidiosus]MCD7084278.1 peptide deformylase [Limosilactobacillus fastidiosus]MCD7085505.1 peptide deformylase [Limosilactobacillus fastidiosus]MCD7114736.1 peptide deformylase [Limosilactobacillus fastidiosus]
MIKPINYDQSFLQQQAIPATKQDLNIGIDLQDTLKTHQNECIGMAANMIGINKAVIIATLGPFNVVMYNPQITQKRIPYQTEEGCLSLQGKKPVTRYRQIKVTFYNQEWQLQSLQLSDLPAEIVQHEVDHLNGILI